jgi:hypothetical protein
MQSMRRLFAQSTHENEGCSRRVSIFAPEMGFIRFRGAKIGDQSRILEGQMIALPFKPRRIQNKKLRVHRVLRGKTFLTQASYRHD